MASFKLPTLRSLTAIVTGAGLPTDFFLRLWNNDLVPRIEGAVTDLQQVTTDLALVQAQQAEQLVQINEALRLAGLALETADSGTPTKSGSSFVSFNLTSATFSTVTTVALTSVLAGDLTIPSTGPSADGSTVMPDSDTTGGEYRIIEVDNGVDNGTVFTGTFSVTGAVSPEPDYVTHTSASAVAAFIDPRTTTGNVDYRLECRKTSGPNISNLKFNLFVRRAA